MTKNATQSDVAKKEVIGLCICIEALDDMVNRAMVDVVPITSFPGEMQAMFMTTAHKDLFLIRALDFVHEGGSESLTGTKGSCLDVLKKACLTKTFDINESCEELIDTSQELHDWLNAIQEIDLWLGSLDIQVKLSITRKQLIYFSGNQSKHNVSRLTNVSRRFADALIAAGHNISSKEMILALDDVREHLSGNYFSYYSTWLVQLFANLRHAIHVYLLPEYRLRYRMVDYDTGQYEFLLPEFALEGTDKTWFWRLMNHVRDEPIFPKLKAWRHLRDKSSLEI
jgi:hypothetical protein